MNSVICQKVARISTWAGCNAVKGVQFIQANDILLVSYSMLLARFLLQTQAQGKLFCEQLILGPSVCPSS